MSNLILMYENNYENGQLESSRPVVITSCSLHMYPTDFPINLNYMFPEQTTIYTNKPLTFIDKNLIEQEDLVELISMGLQYEP